MQDLQIDGPETQMPTWRKLMPLGLAILIYWLWVTVPLVSGQRTFFYRDVHTAHLFYKNFGAEQLQEGRIPAFQTDRALGQPFRGNPNTLAFYPGNLLYLALPFLSAFHLHYMLHWLLALASMWLLARRLGQSPIAAATAAITYTGTGWVLSCLTFYNILTVSAWWPLVLWGMVRGDRRGLCISGAACGLAFLGGDPMSLVIGLVPLGLIAWHYHGLIGGFLRGAALGALALAVASPQIVATMRVLDFTFRGGVGVLPGANSTYALHPVRFLELLVPFPFGSPAIAGPEGFWAIPQIPKEPFIFTIHIGIIGIILIGFASRHRLPWAALGLGGLAAASLGGFQGEVLRNISFGLFRYPEKFIFWFALAAPLLVGWGLDAASQASPPKKRLLLIPGLLLMLGGLIFLLRGPFVEAVAASNPLSTAASAEHSLAGVRSHLNQWVLALGWGAVLTTLWFVLMRAETVRARRPEALMILQCLSVLPMVGLVMTADQSMFDEGAFAPSAPPGTSVASAMTATWDDPGVETSGTEGETARVWVEALASPANAIHGITYPMARDIEGLHSSLFGLMAMNLSAADWSTRVLWCRALGADLLTTSDPVASPYLEELQTMERYDVPFRIYALKDPAPVVWWPEQTTVADNPVSAFSEVNRIRDPISSAVLDRAVDHHPGAQVELKLDQPDRLEIAVSGEGGALAVRRAYFPIWRARIDDQVLDTMPLNLGLLAVEVPQGDHLVVLDVPSEPETVAGILAVLALGAALWLGLGPSSSLSRRLDRMI